MLRRSARRIPDRVAVHYRDRSWTLRGTRRRPSPARPRVLRDTGFGPGDRVAAYGHNSDAYLIAFLACARAGLVHVPVNQNLTGDDLAYILDQSGSTLVLTDPDLAGHAPRRAPASGRCATPTTPCWPALADTPPYDGAEPRAEDLVQLLYTSGHHRAAQGRDDDAPRPGATST